MIDVLITEELVSPAIQKLSEKHRVVAEPALWKDETRLQSMIHKAQCVMIRNQTKLTREILASAPNLLAIGRVGVGLDNIDLDAANDLGIVVIAPLEANAVSVAELTIGLILALARKIPQADRSTKSGQWDRRGSTGIELNGKTLALIGFGRIGRLVAARARAFGMKIVVFDPFIKAEDGLVVFTDFYKALDAADFVSVHLPLTDQTRGMFDDHAFAPLGPGAFFINTSRGGIVNEDALQYALERGDLAGAALDVREVEPPVGENPFASMDNVILTPHIGAFTVEAQARTFEAVCGDLDRVLRGESAINFVNFPSPRK